MSNSSKFLILLISVACVFVSCKKAEPLVTVEIISLSQDVNDIVYLCKVEVEGDNFSASEKGIIWGTSTDLSNNGTKISHSYTSGQYSGTVEDIFFSTTYYFQAYAIVEGKEYLGGIRPLTTGSGWKELTTLPNEVCNNIAVSPNGNVHVVGQNGAHFYSTNEGESWAKITHTNNLSLGQIKFVDENNAFLQAGWGIRKSIDGGMTWSDISVPTNTMGTVYFYDANTYFVSEDDTIFRTINGGLSWTSVYAPSYSGNNEAKSIHFTSPTFGFAVTYGSDVIKTTNGGLSWMLATVTPVYGNGKQIWFVDENIGIAGMSQNLYLSTNGGVNWVKKFGNSGDYINEIDFCNNLVGMVVADDGVLMKTTNAGQDWTVDYYSTDNEDIKDVELLNPNHAYAIKGDGTILKFK